MFSPSNRSHSQLFKNMLIFPFGRTYLSARPQNLKIVFLYFCLHFVCSICIFVAKFLENFWKIRKSLEISTVRSFSRSDIRTNSRTNRLKSIWQNALYKDKNNDGFSHLYLFIGRGWHDMSWHDMTLCMFHFLIYV